MLVEHDELEKTDFTATKKHTITYADILVGCQDWVHSVPLCSSRSADPWHSAYSDTDRQSYPDPDRYDRHKLLPPQIPPGHSHKLQTHTHTHTENNINNRKEKTMHKKDSWKWTTYGYMLPGLWCLELDPDSKNVYRSHSCGPWCCGDSCHTHLHWRSP